MDLLERAVSSDTSIGCDPAVLLAFKSHAALPVDPSWTESDPLLKAYLLAAEQQVNWLTGMPYEPDQYTLTFDTFDWKRSKQTGSGWNVRGFPFAEKKIPMRPVAQSPEPTISWTANDGTTGTWVAGTDFNIVGVNSITPKLYFPYDFVFPQTAQVPYPFVLTWSTTGVRGSGYDGVAKICIFEYAAAYYRKPEMAGQKIDFVSQVFDANLTLLLGSML